MRSDGGQVIPAALGATRDDWAALRVGVQVYPAWQVASACHVVLTRAFGPAATLDVARLLAIWLLDPDEADAPPWLVLPPAALEAILVGVRARVM